MSFRSNLILWCGVVFLALASLTLAQEETADLLPYEERERGQGPSFDPFLPEAPAIPDFAQLEELGTIWLDDALPPGAQELGSWEWDTETVQSGERAHFHPSGHGVHQHGFTFQDPVILPADGKIIQEVWLDPGDPPQGIALRFKLTSGEGAGVYWEGEEEVFAPEEYEALWYYGLLPKLGVWTELAILVEDLGLEDAEVIELRFLTFDGRVLWDRTALKHNLSERERGVTTRSLP